MTDRSRRPPPIAESFVHALAEARARRADLASFVDETVSSDRPRSVFLVGSGGSYHNLGSTWHLLDQHSTQLPAFHRTSFALAARPPALLGPASIVVAASVQGESPETLAAVDVATARGATVLAITRQGDSSLGRRARSVTFSAAAVFVEATHLLATQLGLLLLERTGTDLDVARAWAALDRAPEVIRAALEHADLAVLPAIARAVVDSEITYSLYGEPNSGVATGAGLSFLTEPRKIEAEHSDVETIFGAIETLDEDMTSIVWAGDDDARARSLAVHRFLRSHTRSAMLVDSTALGTEFGPDEGRYLSPLVLAAVSRRLAGHIEAVSGFAATGY